MGILAGRMALHFRNWENHIRSLGLGGCEWVLVGAHKFPFPELYPNCCHLAGYGIEDLTRDQGHGSKGCNMPSYQPLYTRFFSRIFLITKKDGGSRPVINLRPLNQYIRYQHFKMEGMHVVRDLLQSGDWMCKIDLKDAYFSIPVHQNDRRYLQFVWKKQRYCLSFGLSSPP